MIIIAFLLKFHEVFFQVFSWQSVNIDSDGEGIA